MERGIPRQEQLTIREKLQRIGRYVLDACAVAGQAHSGLPMDFTATQGYVDQGLKEIQNFVNNPEDH